MNKRIRLLTLIIFSFSTLFFTACHSMINEDQKNFETGSDPYGKAQNEDISKGDNTTQAEAVSDNNETPDAAMAADEAPKPDEEPVDEEPVDEDVITENPFVDAQEQPASTFSIDVDTASYSLIRRYLTQYNNMPPKEYVRIEEMINYFDYNYPEPQEGKPFSSTIEMAPAPWNPDNELLMVGLQGKRLKPDLIPSSNIVFLIDVSGSMLSSDKLPLLQKSFNLMVDELNEKDTVSIVVYASSTGMVLEPTSCDQKDKIKTAINNLKAGGSTAGGAGIQLAYSLAEENFNSDGNNRVILATDGDFNVGVSSQDALEDLIVEQREKGIFLTVLGFGAGGGYGNYQDAKMETLADKGNGNYFYIDNEKEATKVFVKDLTANLFTIAKDVKLQLVFNPEKIKRYRLIGYENRVLDNEDFNDDKKDAGEIGAGHNVTAFYEVELVKDADNDRVFDEEIVSGDFDSVAFSDSDMLMLRMRYKEPDEEISKYLAETFIEDEYSLEISENFEFASAVTEFGMLLRDSAYKANSSYDQVLLRAEEHIGADPFGFRGEFLELVSIAKELDTTP